MKLIPLASMAVLLGNGAWAADKSILELQRDMALLQDEMKSLDQRLATLQAIVQQIAQQTSDLGARSDARMDKLQAAMDQAIKAEFTQLATPIAAVGAKLDGVASEVSSLRDASGETARQMSSLRSRLDEMNNALKALPAAAPAQVAESQQVTPSKMFTDATGDMNGKPDLALIEFGDFLRLFPTDPMAPQAQFNIGQIHYGQGQFDQAAQDFETVTNRFAGSQQVPDAMYMKGLSFLKAGKKAEAIQEFRSLIMKYTQSSQASQARDLLRALVSAGTSR